MEQLATGLEWSKTETEELLDALEAFAKARFARLETIHEHNTAAAELSEAAGVEMQPGLPAPGEIVEEDRP